MIVSRAPYRVSWAGGGTDLPAFCDHEPGAVLSTSIDLHIYVTVHRRFERNWRISYHATEIADQIEDIRHDLVRESLKFTGVTEPVEITTIGDVPAGTGLGSSSTLTVGLLQALYAFQGRTDVSPEELAAQACEIELGILGRPIGRQDQYAAAFGGINWIEFDRDGGTTVTPLAIGPEKQQQLEMCSLLFYTGQTRGVESILREQSALTGRKRETLRRMRDLASDMAFVLRYGNVQNFGGHLHLGWQLKRSLGCGIETEAVQNMYQLARKAGAWGGKLLGAGGGGFLLVMAPPERHEAIRSALLRPREIPFHLGGPARLVLA